MGRKDGFDLIRCSRCGTVFTTEFPDNSEPLYEDLYQRSRLDDIPNIVQTRATEIVNSFNPWRGRGRLLDVGCGVGHFLEAASEAGWQPEGVEIADSAVHNLTSRGFNVHRGFLHELQYSSDLFDVVVATEVIEHVRDVDAFVAECVRVLRPGGLYYLTTPNGAGLSARLLGVRWSAVVPHDHLQLITPRGIRTLLGRHSLVTRQLFAEGLNPYELVARIRDRELGSGERVASAYTLNTAFGATRARRRVKSTINVALSVTKLGGGLKIYSEK